MCFIFGDLNKMNRKQIKQWFSNRGYKVEFNAIEPVFRNKRIYAVASPNNGGGWNSFINLQSILNYIKERERFELICSE